MPGSTTACDACAIRHRAVCGSLTRDEILQLNQIARHKHVSAGQTILTDHERPEYFANIIAGVVKLTKTLADGRQQIVGLQFPSDFIGRPFGSRSPYYAEAATDVTLCTFGKERFERLLMQHPGIEHRLFEHTLDELDAAQEWMLLLGRKSASEKVASFLLMIARRSRQVTCEANKDGLHFAKFDLPLTRADIGDYLGLTIETVSRQMTRLKSQGIIKLEGMRTVIVPELDHLAEAAEIDQS